MRIFFSLSFCSTLSLRYAMRSYLYIKIYTRAWQLKFSSQKKLWIHEKENQIMCIEIRRNRNETAVTKFRIYHRKKIIIWIWASKKEKSFFFSWSFESLSEVCDSCLLSRTYIPCIHNRSDFPFVKHPLSEYMECIVLRDRERERILFGMRVKV